MVLVALRRVGKGPWPMRKQGTKTKHPGVYRVNDNLYRVRAVGIDPRTGKKKANEKLVVAASVQEAARCQRELANEIRKPAPLAERRRVGEYARLWMPSKVASIDPATARTYADALDQHILPEFGDHWYDAVTKADVQGWINHSLQSTYRTKGGKSKPYARNTVHSWFRVFREMTRDAVETLSLPRDPSARIAFPEATPRETPNAVAPHELVRLLAEFRTRYPQHYGLVTLLAFTGLRFCHGSALRWEDWDEDASVLHVRRKHVRGKVGPVSRKKRAPAAYPVEEPLTLALREHRERLRKAPELLATGWMFPSEAGTLRTPNTLDRAWKACVKASGIAHRFTVHGLRYTFTDLTRLAKVDPVVRRALTGHVTEEMQRKYSTVALDEKRAAVAGALAVLDAAGSVNDGVNAKKTANGATPNAILVEDHTSARSHLEGQSSTGSGGESVN